MANTREYESHQGHAKVKAHMPWNRVGENISKKKHTHTHRENAAIIRYSANMWSDWNCEEIGATTSAKPIRAKFIRNLHQKIYSSNNLPAVSVSNWIERWSSIGRGNTKSSGLSSGNWVGSVRHQTGDSIINSYIGVESQIVSHAWSASYLNPISMKFYGNSATEIWSDTIYKEHP